ncbi:MAG TPA: hypothetical protein VEF07_03805 [Candidatus Binataceae bacterium]|nr:hypothetical protein [Candidatus Binataceae bacterium]
MSFFKMMLVFAPWIAFLIIARGSLFMLKLGIIVAAILTAVMVITRLHRGVIMWAGIVFFSYAFIAVALLNNMWTVRYMGVLANVALAGGTWLGLALRRPFTLEYAREHTDKSVWDDPLFVRTNYLLTLAWAIAFSINAALAWQRSVRAAMPAWAYESISYTLLVSVMFASTWYPQYVRRRREAARQQVDGAGKASAV